MARALARWSILGTLLWQCVNVEALYPQDSLKCKATLARPDQEIICPQARNKYCVLESSNLPKHLCGVTQYFGDVFESKCVYRKCAEECTSGSFDFEYAGVTYTRSVSCCRSDLCNSASALFGFSLQLWLATLVTSVVLLWSACTN